VHASGHAWSEPGLRSAQRVVEAGPQVTESLDGLVGEHQPERARFTKDRE